MNKTDNHIEKYEESSDKGFLKEFNSSFSVNENLSGIYLWLLFALLSDYINCDLRLYLKDSPHLLHALGLYCFFFLFTSADQNNNSNIFILWLKTFLVYILFVMATKTKWYIVLIILTLLFVDRTYKQYVYRNEKYWSTVKFEEHKKIQKTVNFWLTIGLIIVIISGFIHYMWLHKKYYKDVFSFYTFFIGKGKCSSRKKDLE